MAVEHAAGALTPVVAFALIGVLGVGAQWLAWRFRMPGIVIMLGAGLLFGPILGVVQPARDIGPLASSLISLAVAVILFEGGLTLDFRKLGDARAGVFRLVLVGAPIGWLLSALALHYVAGLSWASSSVFGGIMIVTGPTVIAPLLRQARLAGRPAKLLQWEAILADPIGALAAVFAFGIIQIGAAKLDADTAALHFVLGTVFAGVLGLAVGYLVARGFRRGWVPEYMKVPVLFVVLLGVFALSDSILHESGLLAVTVMGVVIANSDLPSFEELRRFKEHATILLVSGVFILLAASMDFASLGQLNWRAIALIASIILVVRPLTVLISLIGSNLPRNERILIATTGPRGVVLVSVAGLFAQRLTDAGVEDGAVVAPLAFALVLATVILHGFSLAPVARRLGFAGAEMPGVILVGGSRFTTGLAEALKKVGMPVVISDPNRAHLLGPRRLGIEVFYGDILSEAAEHQVELLSYRTIIAATDNDPYNTLVTTDFGPEFGRENCWQIARTGSESARHALPTQLGGRPFAAGRTYDELEAMMAEGWTVRATRLTVEFGRADWRAMNPEAVLLCTLDPRGTPRIHGGAKDPDLAPGSRVISLAPPSTTK
ncbi:MAG TPA: sodium:proton antiporter [Albidovulum sp.]|uniref:cation:proton antiporter n=1 Tax=Albidovulum sp. TaxID=1872424 RepID=UPI002BE6695B|nr:sodium:proton antiporter [Albidovulum sp.]